MALPTCNPWTSNTARFSNQQVACRETSARAANFELLGPNFLLGVIDALQRLGVGGVEGFQLLDAYNPCDGEANASNAQCALRNLTPPFQYNEAEAKQIILWQLGNALCANNA